MTPPANTAAPTAQPASSPSEPAPATVPPAADAFDIDSVPESTAVLPPFPFFKPLDGLTSIFDEADRFRVFDVDYFVAGNQLIPVEGKVYRDIFPLEGPRRYSPLEFQRNYEQAITQLGGVKIAGPVATEGFLAQAKPQDLPQGGCFVFSCDANFYLIRQGGREIWISVGTASIPLHGYVDVAERQVMAKSYSFLTADALKTALDAKGRVPVYIEFDFDKATLRPSANPAVAQIVKLMQDNPSLRLSIEGHTDDRGTPDHNRALSLARAETVRGALIAAGVDAARMKTAGFGSDKPLVPNTSDDNRARNRRVELVKIG